LGVVLCILARAALLRARRSFALLAIDASDAKDRSALDTRAVAVRAAYRELARNHPDAMGGGRGDRRVNGNTWLT
jgi:hypothetical protein